jgi:NADH-quinone oxidoreductase subunit M
VFPLHGWLGDAFSEAPVALAMVIAGKLGLYSLLRFHIGLFPSQARQMAPLMIVLAVIGVLYGACLALVQRDFWKLIAFGAVSHFSLVVLAIYGLTPEGWSGAVYQILNLGIVEAAVFVLLGVLDTRYGTSQIVAYGGLAARLPKTAAYFVIASLAMIGLPLLSGFVGEFVILSNTFTDVSKGWAIAAALGTILSAAYMLWLVQMLFYGPESTMAATKPAADLRFSELAALTPLVLLMLAMGVAPTPWFRTMERRVQPPRAAQRGSVRNLAATSSGSPDEASAEGQP